jgi:dCTP deaminase
MGRGALPMQTIREMITGDMISSKGGDLVRPGSLDLTLSNVVYRVRGAFLPSHGETVYSAIKRVGGVKLEGEKILLERNCCYAILLNEEIRGLPQNVYGYCNPKSSSGRVDIHVRTLADLCSRYDTVQVKYSGQLWLLVVPKKFPVIVSQGLSLNQLRFFNSDTRFDETGIEVAFRSGLLYKSDGEVISYSDHHHSDKDGSILLTLGLGFSQPGFKAIETGEPIDLSLMSHYDPRYFFEEISVRDSAITLSANDFYILSTREYVRVPSSLACEMVPMDERSGDLRSHYAGFIDPGWGATQQPTGFGRTLTLEVRSFDSGIIVTDGQPIAKIRYERMAEVPERHYDEMSPTYGQQLGPKLGKNFKQWI